MRVRYHEFESLDHLMANRLLPGGAEEPIRLVVYGGTGAVGGAAVLELCRLVLGSERYREPAWRGEIHATGSSEKEITKFASRLYMDLGDQATIEKVEPRRHYRLGGRIDLHLSVLRLSLPHELPDLLLAAKENDADVDLEAVLTEFLQDRPRPFLEFAENVGENLLHAVVVAIPLPSVAAYTLDALDRIAEPLGLAPPTLQRMKATYLRSFIRGLAIIQQRLARHVVIAHTTAVGGMYRVDGGQPEIRLGFAHSALGKKLVDKKFFADELTQLYLDHGFDVLVTAAAIGIDAVDLRTTLPLDRSVSRSLGELAARTEPPAIDPAGPDAGRIQLYPAVTIDLEAAEDPSGETLSARSHPFGFGTGKDLIVDAAIRSGENGMFSVANCVALYNVMKVAIPEELAVVLVRHALFGPERRADWFQDKICYYAETENSYFALRLLDNHPELDRAHYGAFAIQAYQALGSSTHQARLHELGLVVTLLRLLELGQKFDEISECDLTDALGDLDAFITESTRRPSFADVVELDSARLADLLGRFCTVETMNDAGRLLGFHPRRKGRREPGRERFLARLANRIGRYLDSIQSLGIPILFLDPSSGRERLRLGPYVAPLDRVFAHAAELDVAWADLAEKHSVEAAAVRDWVIVNNGFIDLRPGGLGTDAVEPGPDLASRVTHFANASELEAWLAQRTVGDYFTTAGLTPLLYRLNRLATHLANRKLELGTRETWKHLFPHDGPGRVVFSPGLIETVRMYQEGLGKISGTECLWPSWGY